MEESQSATVKGDDAGSIDCEVAITSVTEPAVTAAGDDASLLMPASSYPADDHNTAEETNLVNSQPTAEQEVDFSRLDIDAEQLVASLFGDDDSCVSFEQPPSDNKKGFVSADDEHAASWFYKDPQGVIQGYLTSMFILSDYFCYTVCLKKCAKFGEL